MKHSQSLTIYSMLCCTTHPSSPLKTKHAELKAWSNCNCFFPDTVGVSNAVLQIVLNNFNFPSQAREVQEHLLVYSKCKCLGRILKYLFCIYIFRWNKHLSCSSQYFVQELLAIVVMNIWNMLPSAWTTASLRDKIPTAGCRRHCSHHDALNFKWLQEDT